jgi:hypothetical protein
VCPAFVSFLFLVGGRPCCFSSSHLHKLGEWRHTAQPALLYNISHKSDSLSLSGCCCCCVYTCDFCEWPWPLWAGARVMCHHSRRPGSSKGRRRRRENRAQPIRNETPPSFYISLTYIPIPYIRVCVSLFSFYPPPKKMIKYFFSSFSVLSADIDVCGSASSHTTTTTTTAPHRNNRHTQKQGRRFFFSLFFPFFLYSRVVYIEPLLSISY